jgi:hypothetical protein
MRRIVFALTMVLASLPGRPRAMTQAEAVALLKMLDTRLNHTFDWIIKAYVEDKERGVTKLNKTLNIYRRDEQKSLIMLFTAPRSEAGSGYLRIKDNLWYYDPKVGKWERRTDRERIGGTSANRKDFDKSTLAIEYDPTYKGEVSMGKGKYTTYLIHMVQKKGANPTYPVMDIWIDKESRNVLKRQEFAASGKSLRTTYFPKWQIVTFKGKQIWIPKEFHIFDDLVPGSVTTVVPSGIDTEPLPANIFTKAWLESKSK